MVTLVRPGAANHCDPLLCRWFKVNFFKVFFLDTFGLLIAFRGARLSTPAQLSRNRWNSSGALCVVRRHEMRGMTPFRTFNFHLRSAFAAAEAVQANAMARLWHSRRHERRSVAHCWRQTEIFPNLHRRHRFWRGATARIETHNLHEMRCEVFLDAMVKKINKYISICTRKFTSKKLHTK